MMISLTICLLADVGTHMRSDSILDQFLCRFWMSGFTFSTAFVASTYSIVALTGERYAALLHPVALQVSTIISGPFVNVSLSVTVKLGSFSAINYVS